MSEVNWSEYLRPEEQLLWTGQPSQKLIHPDWGDLMSLIFWAVPGYLAYQLAVSSGPGVTEYIMFGLFAFVFVSPTIGWIPYNWRLRRHTSYALTDRRVVIRTGIRRPRNHVHELEAWDLPETFFDSADSGTIVFDAGRSLSTATGSLVESGRRGVNNIQFYKITDLQRVQFLVDQVVERKRREATAGAEPTISERGAPSPPTVGLAAATSFGDDFGVATAAVGGDVDWITDLQPEEQLLWAGRPTRQPIIFSCGDLFSVPFFGMFFYLTLTEALVAFQTPEPEDALLGLFVVITGYLSFGKFFHNWWRRSRTRYALTSRRALIRTGPLRRRTHAYGLNPLDEISYDVGADGSGTIVFAGHDGLVERKSRRRSASSDRGTPIENVAAQGLERFEFYRIPDADHVRTLVEYSLNQLDPGRQSRPRPDQSQLERMVSGVMDSTTGHVSEHWAPEPADQSPPPRRSLRDLPPPPGFDPGRPPPHQGT